VSLQVYFTPFKIIIIILIGLYGFATTGTLHNDFTLIFGRDYSQFSRAFKYFVTHMLHHCTHLLYGNLQYWKRLLPYFAECVRVKLEEKTGLQFNEGEFFFSSFYDDTDIVSTRSAGGPTSCHQNAPRRNPLIQRAFYNGYKHNHGIKYETVEAPNGMRMNMFGPISHRHNDLEVTGMSKINDLFRDLQLGDMAQYKCYGDGIFSILSHCIGTVC
jgi:hypothetical protein